MARDRFAEGTIYKEKSGRWPGEVDVREGGRQRKLTRSGRTRTEGIRKMRLLRKELDEGSDGAQMNMPVADLLDITST